MPRPDYRRYTSDPSLEGRVLRHLVRRSNVFGGERPDLPAIRRRALRMSRLLPAPTSVTIGQEQIGGVACEVLDPPRPVAGRTLLYVHGGAWFMGSPRTYRHMLARVANRAGVRVVAPRYRLAPEHPFPGGLEDCLAVYRQLEKEGDASALVLGGDSAGGNLVLATLCALRDAGEALPAGAITLSPATDLTASGSSFEQRRAVDPFFAQPGDGTILDAYLRGADPAHPLASPLFADLRGLPPLLIHVGDHEILLSDSVLFADKARAAGVEVTLEVWPQMFHVFHLFHPLLPEARQAAGLIARQVEQWMEPARRAT